MFFCKVFVRIVNLFSFCVYMGISKYWEKFSEERIVGDFGNRR